MKHWNYVTVIAAAMPSLATAQDCSGWIEREPFYRPDGDGAPGLAYDSFRQVTVQQSLKTPPFYPETWEWDGSGWTLRSEGMPGAPRGTELIYDSFRRLCVAFGGVDTSYEEVNETWEWDGSAWVQRQFPGEETPGRRVLHAMAYDSSRRVTVLFGGQNCDEQGHCGWFGDTWEYDGQHWIERQVVGPSPRADVAMAYDSVRGVTVLYAGTTELGPTDETWEWNGEVWKLTGSGEPGKRYGHAMAFDSGRGVTVLFGGFGNGNFKQDLWQWDGISWDKISADNEPPARFRSAIIYDSTREALVLFGGWDGKERLSDTWEYVCAPPCFPDLDGNLKLDLFDFLAFINLFNAADPSADCDQNGDLDLFDFLCFVNAFNDGCP